MLFFIVSNVSVTYETAIKSAIIITINCFHLTFSNFNKRSVICFPNEHKGTFLRLKSSSACPGQWDCYFLKNLCR